MVDNPYEAPSSVPPEDAFIGDGNSRHVRVRPWSRLFDAKALMGEQYFLFVGICFVALVINAVVPFNLLLGPLACGIHMCFAQRARGEKTMFEKLFNGFDHFVASFVVTLWMILCAFVVTIPMLLLVFGGMVLIASAGQGNEDFIGAAMMMPASK